MHLRSLRADGQGPPPAVTPLSRVVRRDKPAEIYTVIRVAA
jgi:hypothetical protein